MRLVDADALIAQMEADAEQMEVSVFKMATYAAINDVKHQPTIEEREMGRWIPCSERFPKKGQKCLVCNKGTIDIDTFYGWSEPYLWSTYLAEYEAWMPLPQPYEGGDGSEMG